MAVELRIKVCREGNNLLVSEQTGIQHQFNTGGYGYSIVNGLEDEVDLDDPTFILSDATLNIIVPGDDTVYTFNVEPEGFPYADITTTPFIITPADLGITNGILPQGRYCFEYSWSGFRDNPAVLGGNIQYCPHIGGNLIVIDQLECIVDKAAAKLPDLDPAESTELINEIGTAKTLVDIIKDGIPGGSFSDQEIENAIKVVKDLGESIDEEFDGILSDDCNC